MKVILFLAAVYALIYNQAQQKKPPVASPAATINYTQTFTPDTVTFYTPIKATYINVPPSAILNVSASQAVLKSY